MLIQCRHRPLLIIHYILYTTKISMANNDDQSLYEDNDKQSRSCKSGSCHYDNHNLKNRLKRHQYTGYLMCSKENQI